MSEFRMTAEEIEKEIAKQLQGLEQNGLEPVAIELGHCEEMEMRANSERYYREQCQVDPKEYTFLGVPVVKVKQKHYLNVVSKPARKEKR